ncbi:MAG: transcriptional regulator [Halodesulfurarchaeum sp.]
MIRTVSCPVCDSEVRMGVPDDATIEEISKKRPNQPEDDRKKVRKLGCVEGHEFFVYFVR